MTAYQQRIFRWMKREVQADDSPFVDPITNEVRTTALAEYTADKWNPEAQIDLDDDQDPIWDLAVDVSDWWEEQAEDEPAF